MDLMHLLTFSSRNCLAVSFADACVYFFAAAHYHKADSPCQMAPVSAMTEMKADLLQLHIICTR